MHAKRFDGLTRGLATDSSRRRVLGLLAGVGLGGALSLRRQEAEARCPRLRKDTCPNLSASECCKNRLCISQTGQCYKCDKETHFPCKTTKDQGTDQGPGFCCLNESEHCCQCALTEPAGTFISQCAPNNQTCDDFCGV